MEKLPSSYDTIPRLSAAKFLHEHQLPLYGVVYNPDEDEYQHTIGGLVRPESELTVDTSRDEVKV